MALVKVKSHPNQAPKSMNDARAQKMVERFPDQYEIVVLPTVVRQQKEKIANVKPAPPVKKKHVEAAENKSDSKESKSKK